MRTCRGATILVLSFASALAAGAQQAKGAATPAFSAAAEAQEFDFLVGQWELVVTPKATTLSARIHGAPRLLGTWKAWKALDGFGIEDEMRIVDGSGNPISLSHAVRVYNVGEHRWQTNALDVYRARFTSSHGLWAGAAMSLSGQTTDAEGKALHTRSRFFDIKPTGFRFQQDRSSDGGKTWDEGVLKIVAKRVAAVAPR